MNTFKQKTLYAALAGLTVAGVVGTAEAVNTSPDGTGQVLIYPYYTVRPVSGLAYNTLLSIANTTLSTKSVKVRFREGKNSKEVLDFNVFLSPNDMWTAALSPSASGGTLLATGDSSCTIPAIPSTGVEFRNLAYKGDSGGDGLDRTQEGYVEVFEMATYALAAPNNTVATSALHSQSTGLPAACSAISDALGASEATAPTGGLMGGVQYVNVGAGASTSVNATALANWRTTAGYFGTGTLRPALGDADTNSAVLAGTSMYVSAAWLAGVDAVSAVLMHDTVLNEFVLDTGSASSTSWVVTFPTKNEYTKDGTGGASSLFQSNFSGGKSCDDITLITWNREEQTPGAAGTDFSPRVPGVGAQLCSEVNVISFNGKDLFGSANNPTNITTAFQNGWMRLGLPAVATSLPAPAAPLAHTLVASSVKVTLATGAAAAAALATYTGLPVVGFAAFSYTNTKAVTVGGTTFGAIYGLGYPHRFSTAVAP